MTDLRISAINGVRSMLALRVCTDSDDVRDTPARVVRAFEEMTRGYAEDPEKILATTFDGCTYDEMVIVRGVEFVSVCEHHLLPFTGTAVVAYIPKERVVGLSKIPRLVDCYARRLQLQERLTTQIADAMERHLQPRGVAVVMRASHSCLSCRGAMKPGAEMVTSVVRGAIREQPVARAELLALLMKGAT